MENGEKLTFSELFDKISIVEIPIIQRDYAQGRQEQSEVRDTFLNSLFSALTIDNTVNDKQTLNLDFVYGDIDNHNTLSVLDGQQRLTTLFLLHWFLAVKYKHLVAFKERFSQNNKSRFTYKTRPSSSEFFDALVSNDDIEQRYHKITSKHNYSINELISDSTWFFSAWRQDPTVQACLHMLKAIENRFEYCDSDLYLRIIDSNNPYITFQFLSLSNFGLSDELYIKMNARGKPLTPFENFKANLQQIIKSFSEDSTNYNLKFREDKVNAYEYFIHKIDTDWADLFWTYRTVGDNPNTYDDELMNFIRLVILYQYIIDHENHNGKNDDNLNTFFGKNAKLQSLTIAQYTKLNCFTPNFITKLIGLLDLLDLDDDHNHHLRTYLPDTYNKTHYSEVSMFEKVLADDTSYPEKLRFYAFYRFLSKKLRSANNVNADDIQSELIEWVRVIYNLTENTIFNTSKDFLEALLSIEKLSEFDSPILYTLTHRPGLALSRISEDQLVEEKIKAHLILKSNQWKQAILKAEKQPFFDSDKKYPFFNGQIGFLLNFSGILEYYREHGDCEWEVDKNSIYFAHFDKYAQSAGAVFDLLQQNSSDINYVWERAVLSKGGYFTQKGHDRYNLLSSRSTRHNIDRDHSWKRLLRIGSAYMKREKISAKIEKRQSFVKAVLDDADFDANQIELSLQKICDKAIESSELEYWQNAFIKYPELFSYCLQGFILKNDDEFVLFKEAQRNHTQYELYTCILEIELAQNMQLIKPFKELTYQDSTSSTVSASLKLEGWHYPDNHYHFEIFKAPNNFIVQFKNGSSNNYPQEVTDMLESNGLQREYTQGDEAVHYKISSLTTVDEVIGQLIQTCSSLRSIENE